MIRLLILAVFMLTNVPVKSTRIMPEFEIKVPEAIYYTVTPQDMLQAMIWVESGNKGKDAYNPNEPQAAGKLQIWPIMVKEVNRILGYNKYTLQDRLDDKKAEEMFWVYQKYYNPDLDLDKMARIWCGGPDGHLQDCTLPYLNLVNKALYPRR